MIKIGITGGPASGKTTFAEVLVDLGVPYISSDEIAKDLTINDSVVQEEIRTCFMEENIFSTEGKLDRVRLRQFIFSNAIARKKLEEILHPPIIREIQRFFMGKGDCNHKMVAVEVPLLFEANLESLFDRIVLIKLSCEEMQKRLSQRDTISLQLAKEMCEVQWPMEHKEARSHVVIENNGDISVLMEKAKAFYTEEMEKATKILEST